MKVIPKKKKGKSYLENWRPLTILNVDYKIATKTIAHKIVTILPKLISEDQTGYVKGQYIGGNVRLILDLIKVTENIPGIALQMYLSTSKKLLICSSGIFYSGHH